MSAFRGRLAATGRCLGGAPPIGIPARGGSADVLFAAWPVRLAWLVFERLRGAGVGSGWSWNLGQGRGLDPAGRSAAAGSTRAGPPGGLAGICAGDVDRGGLTRGYVRHRARVAEVAAVAGGQRCDRPARGDPGDRGIAQEHARGGRTVGEQNRRVGVAEPGAAAAGGRPHVRWLARAGISGGRARTRLGVRGGRPVCPRHNARSGRGANCTGQSVSILFPLAFITYHPPPKALEPCPFAVPALLSPPKKYSGWPL
jgi:hypothetical protein